MIELVKVKDKAAGQVKAHEILRKIVDNKTLLALSGGTSVDYQKMIVEPPLRQGFEGQAGDIEPGAICVVDERYGEPFHKDSNELLLRNQGVKECTDEKCIEARKYLVGLGFEETAKKYDGVIVDLFSRFPKRIGVMGVGTNLHTAGIFPNSKAVKSDNLVEAVEVEDTFKKRLTLTVKALEQFTAFVVMMFGSSKKKAIEIMMDEKEDDLEKYPAVFYRKGDAQCFLITDVKL